ncbi:hypothetical protein Hanom_Chr01g00088741 [Helianthus anomalus]
MKRDLYEISRSNCSLISIPFFPVQTLISSSSSSSSTKYLADQVELKILYTNTRVMKNTRFQSQDH